MYFVDKNLQPEIKKIRDSKQLIEGTKITWGTLPLTPPFRENTSDAACFRALSIKVNPLWWGNLAISLLTAALSLFLLAGSLNLSITCGEVLYAVIATYAASGPISNLSTIAFKKTFILLQFARLMLPDESTMKARSTFSIQSVPRTKNKQIIKEATLETLLSR